MHIRTTQIVVHQLSILTAKYQIERPTELDSKVVLEKIFWVLNDREYQVTDKSDQFVKFDDASGKIRLRGRPTQIEQGVFELIKSNDLVTVKLIYTQSFAIQAVFLLIIGLIALSDYHILYLAVCLVIFSLIHFFSFRQEAKELMLNAVDGSIKQPGISK